MSSNAVAPKVFISYSHDSADHRERTLALSNRLRGDGIDCVIDRYREIPPPAEGWPRWMESQIHQSNFVLAVCTETYERRVSGRETPGVGVGAKFEGAIITQKLYNAEMQNTQFIPVAFSAEDLKHIPVLLQATNYYRVDTEAGYERLYRHLTGQPEVIEPPLGTPRIMPPHSPIVTPAAPPLASSFKNSIGVEFILIPAGKFLMGSNEYGDEKPIHEVTIGKPFYMGKYQVTQGEWKAVMGSNPSHFIEDDPIPVELVQLVQRHVSTTTNDRLPVEQVSWNDCQEFIKRLNGRNDGWEYRLPSEAEWEYACRAGTTGDYAGELDAMGWYGKNSGSKTHPVGEKKPNAWGLHDMHGNVWEWCQDRYHENYNGAPSDGSAWETDSDNRWILRGGSWLSGADLCRSAFRGDDPPDYRSNGFGFRLVAARIS